MSNNNAQLAPINTESLVGRFNAEELKIMKQTIAKGTTDEQFALFVQTAASAGLNPFLGHIICSIYETTNRATGQKEPVMSIQPTVEGLDSLAKKRSDYIAVIGQPVKQNDEFEADIGAGTVTHKITSLDRGRTIGAYAIALRKDAPPVLKITTLDDVKHLINSERGGQKKMWNDWQDDMLVKHSKKRAIKEQFGVDIDEEELVNTGRQRIDITEEVDRAGQAAELPPKVHEAEVIDPEEAAAAEQTATIERLQQQVTTKFEALRITDKRAKAAFIRGAGLEISKEPTVDFLKTLINALDMEALKRQQAAEDELPE